MRQTNYRGAPIKSLVEPGHKLKDVLRPVPKTAMKTRRLGSNRIERIPWPFTKLQVFAMQAASARCKSPALRKDVFGGFRPVGHDKGRNIVNSILQD